MQVRPCAFFCLCKRHRAESWLGLLQETDLPDEAYDEEADQTYVKMALGCLHRDKFPRDAFIALVDPKMNPWFDRITITVILGNCISLALYNPFDPDCETDRCKVLEVCDIAFSIYFTIECICKIVAMGFCGEKTYLSNSWNQMDFIVVVFGLIDFLPGDQAHPHPRCGSVGASAKSAQRSAAACIACLLFLTAASLGRL